MKIDIHTHTKKCKSGDARTREISPAEFCEIVLSTDVGIVAITNHNLFDLRQFEEIDAGLGGEIQVWPGVELDIDDNGKRGHLLVIVCPMSVSLFSDVVQSLTTGSSPDSFTTTVEQVLETFEDFNPLYIAHYKHKKPSLSDEVLEKLEKGTKNPHCVIKEVTNSISAGIYISHGYSSIYGSDIQDWSKYVDLARSLPDLRLPVDSFDHFGLLLKKDSVTINTVLDRKTPEELSLKPFDDESILKLKVFNDINIVFGPKGTGKSCILQAIARHYSDNGIEAKVFESASDRLNDIFDIKGKDLSVNLNDYGIDYCNSEIDSLLKACEVPITSLSNYLAYFSKKTTNRNATKILLKDIEPEEETRPKQKFEQFDAAVEKTTDFLKFLEESPLIKEELEANELKNVTQVLSELRSRLYGRKWDSFSLWKETSLLNSAIEITRREVGRKTGSPSKPTTTGFLSYAKNRVKLKSAASTILKSIKQSIPLQIEHVGSLGASKGSLEFITEFKFQTGSIADGSLTSLTGIKKNPPKQFANCMGKIFERTYSDDLFQCISELNEIEDVEQIKTVHQLLLFNRYFSLDGQDYSPSSGEASMLMLHKELEKDKEVYILDEPERSLGNDYINDVIVPLVRERARVGKKVFISTHDANIAVRTLPYCSIFRCHEKSGYKTYTGNPFTNNLINPENSDDQLDWKKISMRTLEGGEEAFGERGVIYGHM